MKKILIISPHYPPSNLAAVHRTRLFAEHLPAYNWDPYILTVNEKYYEETLDWNLYKLLPKNQKIFKVDAYNVTKPRLIGDIGLRAFFQLRRKALELVKEYNIDFLYIPIPSFYVSLIGPYIFKKTGIPYGIDYIDPWVHVFPGSDRLFSRHWWSTRIARFLEPIAVKHAALITGVAQGYFDGVLQRNPKLKLNAITGAMPYGGERDDHKALAMLNLKPYLFDKKDDKLVFIYAGALLPKAFGLLRHFFATICEHRSHFVATEFHFVGTGSRANDNNSYTVRPFAEEYQLWGTIVHEYPKRIPYLDVLTHLDAADCIFILGSTEPHYTPSKSYQGVLSGKPIMAILHEKSTAVQALETTNAGKVFQINATNFEHRIASSFLDFFKEFLVFQKIFNKEDVDQTVFEEYSANAITGKLAQLLENVIIK